jgi:hypothetical protein
MKPDGTVCDRIREFFIDTHRTDGSPLLCSLCDQTVEMHKPQVKEKPSPEVLAPIPMILFCPLCHGRHLDEGEFATKVHHTHACQICGNIFRPALVATVGVMFLPGMKNEGPGKPMTMKDIEVFAKTPNKF